jgi:hypothetical protein
MTKWDAVSRLQLRWQTKSLSFRGANVTFDGANSAAGRRRPAALGCTLRKIGKFLAAEAWGDVNLLNPRPGESFRSATP